MLSNVHVAVPREAAPVAAASHRDAVIGRLVLDKFRGINDSR